MKVLKEETAEGTLKKVIFQRETEDMTGFKAAVKYWIEGNFPGWDEKQIYETMVSLDMNRVVLEVA